MEIKVLGCSSRVFWYTPYHAYGTIVRALDRVDTGHSNRDVHHGCVFVSTEVVGRTSRLETGKSIKEEDHSMRKVVGNGCWDVCGHAAVLCSHSLAPRGPARRPRGGERRFPSPGTSPQPLKSVCPCGTGTAWRLRCGKQINCHNGGTGASCRKYVPTTELKT